MIFLNFFISIVLGVGMAWLRAWNDKNKINRGEEISYFMNATSVLFQSMMLALFSIAHPLWGFPLYAIHIACLLFTHWICFDLFLNKLRGLPALYIADPNDEDDSDSFLDSIFNGKGLLKLIFQIFFIVLSYSFYFVPNPWTA